MKKFFVIFFTTVVILAMSLPAMASDITLNNPSAAQLQTALNAAEVGDTVTLNITTNFTPLNPLTVPAGITLRIVGSGNLNLKSHTTNLYGTLILRCAIVDVNGNTRVNGFGEGTIVVEPGKITGNPDMLNLNQIIIPPNSYIVTFLDWDGVKLGEVIVLSGQNATPPTDPTREGYTFTGWDKSFTNVTTDLTVVALYDIGAYIVTFMADGSVFSVQTVAYGGSALNPGAPSKIGYTFNGWDKDFTNITANLTVNAIFSDDPIEYNISYILNGGENDPANPATYNVTSPAITLKDPAKPGFTFVEWLPTNSIPSGSTGDKEFTATWSTTPIEYNISYILNGGENDPANPATYNVTSPAITLKDPTKPGYEFLGWQPAANIPTGSTGDKEFTATWSTTPIEYNISYILNGGENDPANPATYNVTSPAITLKDPTKPGFTFVEWLPTNSIPSGSTGDKEFTATWKSSFVPVIDIIDVPSTAYANVPLPLNGTVLPSDATNQTIIWNIKDAGITGATLNGNILDIVAPGVLVVTATIVDGLAIGTDFVKDFSITVLLSEKYNYNVYLIPDKTVAKAGEYLYLDIMLVGNLNYFQLTSELTYNNSLLEYIGFEDPQGWMHETRVTAANAVTTRQLPSANTITGTVCNPPVKIVTLVFKVDENFSGNSVITDFVFTNLVVACPQASFVGAPTSWGKTLNIVITE